MNCLSIAAAALVATGPLVEPPPNASEDAEDGPTCSLDERTPKPTLEQVAWMAYECTADALATKFDNRLFYIRQGWATVDPNEFEHLLRVKRQLDDLLSDVRASLANSGWNCGTCIFIPEATIKAGLLECYADEVGRFFKVGVEGKCRARHRKYLAVTRRKKTGR